ncbi:MAG: hypothetical protein RLZZ165_394 [Bacteroidota bacterium]|jgi:hypothetical protein
MVKAVTSGGKYPLFERQDGAGKHGGECTFLHKAPPRATIGAHAITYKQHLPNRKITQRRSPGHYHFSNSATAACNRMLPKKSSSSAL